MGHPVFQVMNSVGLKYLSFKYKKVHSQAEIDANLLRKNQS